MDKEDIKKLRQSLNGSLSKLDEVYAVVPDAKQQSKVLLKNIIGQTVIYSSFVNDCLQDGVDIEAVNIQDMLLIVKDHCKAVMTLK